MKRPRAAAAAAAAERCERREMALAKFLREYHYEDWYLTNIAPAEMMAQLVVRAGSETSELRSPPHTHTQGVVRDH